MKLLLLALLFASFCCSAYSSEYRQFRDKLGRTMEAKIIRVSEYYVYVKRADGQKTKVRRSEFSAEDTRYIDEWEYNAILEKGVFDVSLNQQISDKNKRTHNGVTKEIHMIYYDIVISNKVDRDIENIEVKYLMLKFEDTVAGKKNEKGETKRIEGSISIDKIEAKEKKVSVSTEKVSILKASLEPGYVWSNGGKQSSEDAFEGIWIRVYVDDKLVNEMSKPKSLMRKENGKTLIPFFQIPFLE